MFDAAEDQDKATKGIQPSPDQVGLLHDESDGLRSERCVLPMIADDSLIYRRELSDPQPLEVNGRPDRGPAHPSPKALLEYIIGMFRQMAGINDAGGCREIVIG